MTAYAMHRREPKISSEIAFGEFLLGYVAAGAGVSIVPELIARPIGYLALGSLPITDFPVMRVIGLVGDPAKPQSRVSAHLQR
ncbi:LysR substrate-binding domain-containing protein [Brevibacillus dissolubilis]|uniref:LysR substrate-binding domain-containing protein n=1 Tax=Brevibacillus dissolubilis TaxID=1844116 RepID=UPI002100105C|nr:LysR substrate-binding domain-containing protein [Brevibacillus dissolubilis]